MQPTLVLKSLIPQFFELHAYTTVSPGTVIFLPQDGVSRKFSEFRAEMKGCLTLTLQPVCRKQDPSHGLIGKWTRR